jgi:ribosomal protein S8E
LIVNIPASALGIAKENLSESDVEVLESFHKLNILAYKADPNNPEFMEQELLTIRSIINIPPYEELMAVKDRRLSGKVIVVGKDTDLEEVVFFGHSPQAGFVLARVLGNQMTAQKVAQFTSLIQEENVDPEVFAGLQNFF